MGAESVSAGTGLVRVLSEGEMEEEEKILIHRSRSYSDDFETDQAIRFERVAHVQNLVFIEQRIKEVQDELDRLEQQRESIEAAIDEWEKQYGCVEE